MKLRINSFFFFFVLYHYLIILNIYKKERIKRIVSFQVIRALSKNFIDWLRNSLWLTIATVTQYLWIQSEFWQKQRLFDINGTDIRYSSEEFSCAHSRSISKSKLNKIYFRFFRFYNVWSRIHKIGRCLNSSIQILQTD